MNDTMETLFNRTNKALFEYTEGITTDAECLVDLQDAIDEVRSNLVAESQSVVELHQSRIKLLTLT